MKTKLGRLKKEKLIGALFDKGASIKKFPLILFYAPSAEWQSGVSVSKKLFKRAVDRNRIKRLLREAIKQQWPRVSSFNVGPSNFMILYIGKTMPDFEAIDQAANTLFDKFLERIKNHENE